MSPTATLRNHQCDRTKAERYSAMQYKQLELVNEISLSLSEDLLWDNGGDEPSQRLQARGQGRVVEFTDRCKP